MFRYTVFIFISVAHIVSLFHTLQACEYETEYIDRLRDDALSGSSIYDPGHGYARSRLNTQASGWYKGAWASRTKSVGEYIEADLGEVRHLTAIATQGRQDRDEWVSSYHVRYSVTGSNYERILDDDSNDLEFIGNNDRNSVVKHRFDRTVLARFIRVYPQTWHEHISMRWGVYGCNFVCASVTELLSSIPDASLTASSQHTPRHSPARSRLQTTVDGNLEGGWAAATNDANQYLQADLGSVRHLVKIATQGRSSSKYTQYVRRYYFSHSLTDSNYQFVSREDGTRVLFNGNTNRYSVVDNSLQPPVDARYVRVHPEAFYGHISMRWGIYGCDYEIDECASDPCQNEATCENSMNGFTCQCLGGFTGTLCETDVDECDSNPCGIGGKCNDRPNGFTCDCQNGFTGTFCETDIDDCAFHSCQNNASCIDGVDEFTCLCLQGFEGTYCDTDIDECASNPCFESGTCENFIGRFQCHCDAGFTGILCENAIGGGGLLDDVKRQDLVISLVVGALLAVICLIILAVLVYHEVKDRSKAKRRAEAPRIS